MAKVNLENIKKSSVPCGIIAESKNKIEREYTSEEALNTKATQKPIPLRIKPDGIPLTMQERKQWVAWKYQWSGNKWTKPPFHISGKFKASTTNPATWSTFEEAYAAYLAGHIDGIGYVFGQDDGLVGVDVDHCIDFVSHKKYFTKDEARLIVQQFQPKAYIERSVGGDGMHLIVQAEALRCGKGKGKLSFIEVYDATSPRYFTVSGHRLLSGQEEPLSAQEELNWLHTNFLSNSGQTGSLGTSAKEKSYFDAENPVIDRVHVELLVQWLRDADLGHLWRDFGEEPSSLVPLFEQEWREPYPSASDLDMKVFGKLAWYAVLHLRIDDSVVGHIIMAVYRQWPGYRGEEGERKAQYGIAKALESAFAERERQINEGLWKDTVQTISPEIFCEPVPSSNILEFPKQPVSISPYTMPRPFPGVMEEIVAYTLRTSPKPQPDLALMAALIGMSSSCAGSYYLSMGSMRLNLYGLGIAETGAGKDHPRYVAAEVVRKAAGKVISKPASGQGLEDQLISRVPMLMEVDEAAHLFQELNARDQNTATVNLNSMLLKLYSASRGIFSTRAKALSTKSILQSGPRDIYNPTLNILGFSTPEKLGEVLTSQNIADGMLGRMLFATGQTGIQPRRAASEVLPNSIVQAAAKLKSACVSYVPQQPDTPCYLNDIPIKETKAAGALLDSTMIQFSKKTESTDGVMGKALFARSFEKCYRIAGVLAVWDDPKGPEIDVHHVEWAREFILASDAAALQFCDGYFHGGQTQGDAALIVKVIRKVLEGQIRLTAERDKKFTQGGYVTHSLVLKHTKLDKKRFDEALAHLEDAGQISRGQVDDAKPNGRAYKVKLLSLEDAA